VTNEQQILYLRQELAKWQNLKRNFPMHLIGKQRSKYDAIFDRIEQLSNELDIAITKA